MVLFLILNSKKHEVREFQVILFAQHGTGVRSDDIRHVICDQGERALQDLGWERLPVN